MKTNISKRNYTIVGFENGSPFKVEYSIAELLSNSENDTELLYSIQEDYIDDIIGLSVGQTMYINSLRDCNFGCGAVVCRTS